MKFGVVLIINVNCIKFKSSINIIVCHQPYMIKKINIFDKNIIKYIIN
jgi:hypothetical protein